MDNSSKGSLEGKEIVLQLGEHVMRDHSNGSSRFGCDESRGTYYSDDASIFSCETTTTEEHRAVAKAIIARGGDTKEIVHGLLHASHITAPSTHSLSSRSTLSSHRRLLDSPKPSRDVLVLQPARLASLVTRLLARDAKEGLLPEALKGGNALARRLTEIFSFPPGKDPSWLWRPVYEAFISHEQQDYAKSKLNIFLQPPSNVMAMPLLSWLCQPLTMKKLARWRGGNDVVHMLLAAGADPNLAVPQNGCTPIFFAVKYGNSETVRLLVEAGADVTKRDKKKRSCLWNALERPQADIISYLLELRRNDDDSKKVKDIDEVFLLDAHEGFPYQRASNNRRRRRRRQQVQGKQTAVDYMFASQLSMAMDPDDPKAEYPWSWQILGAPHPEKDVALSMIEFWKRGVSFSPQDNVTLALLSFILRGDDPNRKRMRYPNYIQAQPSLERLARLFLGLWMPLEVHKHLIHGTPPKRYRSSSSNRAALEDASYVSNGKFETAGSSVGEVSSEDITEAASTEATEEMNRSASEPVGNGGFVKDADETAAVTEDAVPICQLCEGDMDGTTIESITLHCGHEFCLVCIQGYATGDNARPCHSFCPTCFTPLCKEVTGRRLPNEVEMDLAFQDGCFGPLALSNNQIRLECHEWKMQTILRTDEGLKRRMMERISSVSQQQPEADDDESADDNEDYVMTVELNSPIRMQGVDVPIVPPQNGPVVFSVSLRGIPVLAYLSTTSYCTLVHPSVVEIFGFKKKSHLKSQFFRTALGTDWLGDQFAALEDFECTLTSDNEGAEDVRIRLPHALEAPLPSCVGLQLGQDFFQSSAWTVVDLHIDAILDAQGNDAATVDSFGHIIPQKVGGTGGHRRREELRYHTRDGKQTIRKPLFHLQPFLEGGKNICLSDEGLDECDWCCRKFPGENMRTANSTCWPSEVAVYCSAECQESASKLSPVS